MKNLSRYDENLSVPRKQDVDDKQPKIDVDGILQGDGNGNISAAETTQTSAVPIPVGIMKGTAAGSIETATPGTDYALQSLGMYGATVGQVPTVKTIDAQGRPVEWEPANLGGGSDVFIITVGATTDNGDGTYSFTPDKTYEEVNTAILNGKQCYVKYIEVYYPLVRVQQIISDDGAVYVDNAIFTVALQGLAMQSITMTNRDGTDTATTWLIQATETATSFPSNPSNGQVLYYRTGLGRGWHATNIGTSLATDFTGLIKGTDGKLAQAVPGTDYLVEAPVTTVNGKTGEVQLTADDVGALAQPATMVGNKWFKTDRNGAVVLSDLPGATTSTKGITWLVNDYTRTDTDRSVTPKALNDVYKMFNRTTAVNAADTNYTTYMARGEALFAEETTPTVNGCIAWQYE